MMRPSPSPMHRYCSASATWENRLLLGSVLTSPERVFRSKQYAPSQALISVRQFGEIRSRGRPHRNAVGLEHVETGALVGLVLVGTLGITDRLERVAGEFLLELSLDH